eukprot:scaffold247883_cov19-Tisochrysis_lutea.AAC.1
MNKESRSNMCFPLVFGDLLFLSQVPVADNKKAQVVESRGDTYALRAHDQPSIDVHSPNQSCSGDPDSPLIVSICLLMCAAEHQSVSSITAQHSLLALASQIPDDVEDSLQQ